MKKTGHPQVNIGNSWGLIAAVIVVLSCVLYVGWVGHVASDDRGYISAALGWINDFPFVPDTHWETRHSLTMPMALAFIALGFNEFSTIVPTLAYSLLILFFVYLILRRYVSDRAGLLGVLLLSSAPIFSESATIPTVDPVEAFYVYLSLYCFLSAAEPSGKRHTLWLLGAGFSAGLAFIARETTGALLVFYGLSFLFWPLMARGRYWIMAIPFCLVVGGEMLYYFVQVGDPLLRFNIVFNIKGPTGSIAGTGNISDSGWYGPLLSLLINNEYGLIFWLLVPAAWSVLRSRHYGERSGIFFKTVMGLGVVWFIVIGYFLDLRALPRYFYVSLIPAVIAIAIWLDGILKSNRAWMGYSIMVLVVASDLLLIDLSNQQYLLAERTMVELLARGEIEKVHTDPRTAWRSEQLADWANVSRDRIITGRPMAGDYFFYSPSSVERGNAGPYGLFDRSDYEVKENWEAIYQTRGDPTYLGRMFELVRVDGLIQEMGLGRLIWENIPVTLFRVKASDKEDSKRNRQE